jgi:transposase InsO family protein
MIDQSITDIAPMIGAAPACRALGASRASLYRRRRGPRVRDPRARRPQPRALSAAEPNELHTWDITKLKGPAKWTYFYLYVILDVYSRYVVGWTVQHRESAQVAKGADRSGV